MRLSDSKHDRGVRTEKLAGPGHAAGMAGSLPPACQHLAAVCVHKPAGGGGGLAWLTGSAGV